MEALEIERQTDQTPLARSRLFPAQRELAEAKYLLDDPNDWFNRAFACPIDRFAQSSLKLVGHLHLGIGVLRRWIGQRCKTLLPTWMMWVTTSCDVRFNT